MDNIPKKQEADLLRRSTDSRNEELTTSHLPILPRPRETNFLPLSFTQQSMWILDQLEPNNTSYAISIALQIQGILHVRALEQTLNEIIHRHEALRTIFPSVEGQPRQVVLLEMTLNLSFIDLSSLLATKQESEIMSLAMQEKQLSFDLAQGPLLRTTLLRLDQQKCVFLVTMHHIISDGWSIGVFRRELSALYAAFSKDAPIHLPTLPIQYADFAIWQHQCLQGKVLQEQLDYWKTQLANIPPALSLPTDHSRPVMQTFRGATQSRQLSKKLSDALTVLSRRERVPLFMTLLAAFQTLLFRYSGQEDIVVGFPIANRRHIETATLIGFFANTLVLRTDLSGNPFFRDVLKRVREVVLGAYAHQELPFEKLVEELHPERDLNRNPFFQTMFVWQNIPVSPLELTDVHLCPLHIPDRTAKFNLTLTMKDKPQGLVGTLEYHTDLFEETIANRMLSHLQILLEGIVATPWKRIAELPVLSEPERQQLLEERNTTQQHFPLNRCIHQLFEDQVEISPEAIAVVYEEEHLSYQELNRRANQLGRYLQQQGVGPGVLVGIGMERSILMLVGILAVLKAGGAYIPLDPSTPSKHLAFLLDDAQISILLTQHDLLEQFPSQVAHRLTLDIIWVHLAPYPQDNLIKTAILDDLAYVIYTSGSTGRPKGVLISHQALTNFLLSMCQEPGITVHDTLLAVTTLSFDIAGLELYLPLIVGARLVIASRIVATTALTLAETLTRTHTTMMQATPTTWRMLLSNGWQAGSYLKLLCGGEALPLELAHQLIAHGASLYNMYGPTETTIWSTLYQIKPKDTSISIGRPIANTTIYILDQHLQLVPVGVHGELYIGGSGLAYGYLNRPDLTAECFICHPFSAHPADRLYRTGDLARYRHDGTIELIGRLDYQIKLRGYRIELGEIEAVLSQHPAVSQSVVLLRQDVPHDARLVAYIVPDHQQTVNPKELRQYLQQCLPNYMVPSSFVLLEALPLTPNGKLNREVLPAPEQNRALLAKQFVAPQNPIEKALAELWMKALRVDQVGIHDDFFALGGHSMLATQILFGIRTSLQVEVSLRTLFITPTIAQLAAYITNERSNNQQVSTLSLTPAEQGPITGPLPFTIGQRWVLKEMQATPPRYQKMSQVFIINRPIRPALLELALQYVLRHHDILRLRLLREHEEWHQFIIAPDQDPTPFLWVDFSGLCEDEQEKEAHSMAVQLRTDLDKMQKWLLRMSYFDFGLQKAGNILFNFNHIITDYVSNEIVFQDFLSVYQQLSQGKHVNLPPKTASFKQWAERIIAYLHSDELKQEMEDFWLKLPWKKITPLPLDYPEGKPFDTFATNRTVRTLLSIEETNLLHQCLNTNTQILDILLTALVQAFHHWTGSPFLYVHVPYHGRELVFDDLDLSRTVGFISFGKMTLLDVSEADTPENALQHIQEQLRSLPHQMIGLDLLLQLGDEHIQKKVQKIPHHEVLFDYRGRKSMKSSEIPLFSPIDKYQSILPDGHDYRNATFNVKGRIADGCLCIDWEYGEKLHNKNTVEKLGTLYIEALRELIIYIHKQTVR